MSALFEECATRISRLDQVLIELERDSRLLQLTPLAEREWFELLRQKLIPQMSDSAFLIAAVTGGTNIGKSVVFNHLAGTRASAVSPLASGTKHPVCLVPDGFTSRHELEALFPGFELRAWSSADAALGESSKDLLFWRACPELPPSLLVLDTPDIDSDARVNWDRADRIRRAADVLIAVLTQQKYNDAAVKEFFRRAAAEDKFVLVVFNQVHLPDDETYWPLWLKTFCDETGIRPGFVYLAPHDRRAAEENRLMFFERDWPIDPAPLSVQSTPASEVGQSAGRRLREDLSALHFGEIKLRTLRGSLDVVTGPAGVPAWLDEIRHRSEQYRTAAELLSAHKLAEIDDWPALPGPVLVQAIRGWWQAQRSGWSATVHGFYNRIGQELTGTWRRMREFMTGPAAPPLDEYREREWAAILKTVDAVYERLNWFRELGNPLLQPRLTEILGATSRVDLLHSLRAAHLELPLSESVTELVTRELESFREASPVMYRSLRQLDSVAAAVRPATSIALFVTGFGPVGHAVGHLATETMVASAVTMAGDVAAGSLTAAVGETWLSSTTSTGVAWLEARLRRIHEQFAAQRAAWLAERLHAELLGSLPDDLHRAARIPERDAFRQAESLTASLRELLTVPGQR